MQKENQKKLRVAGCVFGGVTASQKAQPRNPQLCNFHRYGLTLSVIQSVAKTSC